MSLLNKRSAFDLIPGNTPQTSNPQTQNQNPVPENETVGYMGKFSPEKFNNGPESKIPGERDTLHERSLEELYNSKINGGASYGAGQPGGTYPTLAPTNLDLNGNTPAEYLNRLPR